MKTNHLIHTFLVSLLLTGSTGLLFSGENDWSGTCRVTFSGESTLHNFTGTVDAEPFTVSISSASDLANATASSHVVVKAAGMNSDNKKRDKEMYKCMEVTTYPEIIVDLDKLPVAETKPALDGPVPRPTVIPFTMTLKGKEHQMTGTVSNWSFKDESVDCVVSFPVSLEKSGITPPSVLGLVKMKDEIKVTAVLHLKHG
jgi:hypothetical protein